MSHECNWISSVIGWAMPLTPIDCWWLLHLVTHWWTMTSHDPYAHHCTSYLSTALMPNLPAKPHLQVVHRQLDPVGWQWVATWTCLDPFYLCHAMVIAWFLHVPTMVVVGGAWGSLTLSFPHGHDMWSVSSHFIHYEVSGQNDPPMFKKNNGSSLPLKHVLFWVCVGYIMVHLEHSAAKFKKNMISHVIPAIPCPMGAIDIWLNRVGSKPQLHLTQNRWEAAKKHVVVAAYGSSLHARSLYLSPGKTKGRALEEKTNAKSKLSPKSANF